MIYQVDKCIVSGVETKNKVEQFPVSKEVVEFANWYRDRLNVQQKKKIAEAVNAGVKSDYQKAYVTTKGCLNLFMEMKSKGYSWDQLKERLTDELKIKGIYEPR